MAVNFPDFVPVALVHLGGTVIAVIVMGGLLYRFYQWRKVAPPQLMRDIRNGVGWSQIIKLFFSELFNRALLQRDVIHLDKVRWLAHFLLFWGFVGAAVTTTLVYIFNPEAVPTPITDPIRILGNASGVLLLLGGTVAIIRVTAVEKYRRERTLSGMFFLAVLYLVIVTGFTTEAFSEVGDANAAFFNYAIHLAAVALLFTLAPFTHFFHALSTPSFRYMERLKQTLLDKIAAPDYKEAALLNQIEARYAERETKR